MLLRVSLLAVVFIYCMMSYRIGYMISFLFIVQNRFTLCGKCIVCFFMCRENGEKVEKRNIKCRVPMPDIYPANWGRCHFRRWP